jgi:polar amino acid transport system substrate-binding protein
MNPQGSIGGLSLSYLIKLIIIIISVNFELLSESWILKDIKDSGILNVSVSQTYEPFYIENPVEGHPGFDVELATDLAKYLGVSVNIIPLKEISDHENALSSKKVHITMAGVSSSLERMKNNYFSDPYLITTPAGLVNRSVLPPEPEGQIVSFRPLKSLSDLENLPGIVYSVRRGSKSFEYLSSRNSKNTIYSFLTTQSALNELKKNTVNCFAADSFYILALMQKEPTLKSSYLPLVSPVKDEFISVMMGKDDLEFLTIINMFIREQKRSGRINELSSKYFLSNIWVKNQ